MAGITIDITVLFELPVLSVGGYLEILWQLYYEVHKYTFTFTIWTFNNRFDIQLYNLACQGFLQCFIVVWIKDHKRMCTLLWKYAIFFREKQQSKTLHSRKYILYYISCEFHYLSVCLSTKLIARQNELLTAHHLSKIISSGELCMSMFLIYFGST